MSVLAITGAIGLFLGYQSIPTLRHYGLHFFTQTNWQPELNQIGIAAVLVGTVEVALVAMVGELPAGADVRPVHHRLRAEADQVLARLGGRPDGGGAEHHLRPVGILPACSPMRSTLARWLSQYFGWIPHLPRRHRPQCCGVAAVALHELGVHRRLAVAMMAIPLACAVMRAVFDQAPLGEREAAMALGGTRFGVARTVVLPFAKGGIIGGTMLALGRALGETAAVLIIISPAYEIKARILEAGTQTVSALIAGELRQCHEVSAVGAADRRLRALLDHARRQHGAAVFIRRSRSGAGTEI